MCWCSKKEPVRKIAEKDISVRKILYVLRTDYQPKPRLRSPYKYFFWRLEKRETVTEFHGREPYLRPNSEYKMVYGFHSCKHFIRFGRKFYTYSWWPLRLNFFDCFSSSIGKPRIFKAIIPRGSEYYVNEDGDYISESLIIVKQCNFLGF